MMLKKEIIWREILFQKIENKRGKFQQKELAEKFRFSLSTIHNALEVPRKTGAIKVTGRFFILENPEKMLYLWATFRNPQKDVIYQTFSNRPVRELEALMPEKVIFGCYSAYWQKFHSAPADYDKVYIYLEKEYLSDFKKRFPLEKGEPNVIVLEADKFLKNYGKITPLSQTFVDIWNLPEWYAQDFYKEFKGKLCNIITI